MAGDVFNTTVHLARLGRRVAFLSALGGDPFSRDLLTACEAESIDTRLILTDPARNCGLYAIRTDAAGERSFAYWRTDSAARQLFALPGVEAIFIDVETADLFVFSLISLAILPDEGRRTLIMLAERVRERGGGVAFDGNYRPRLWNDAAEARRWRDRAVAASTIGPPTLENEAALDGPTDAGRVAEQWRALGAGEVVVKLGAQGCRTPGGSLIAPPAVLTPVDTSGAGDAFNAGYLHARLAGAPFDRAAMIGHRLAGWVIGHPGAVPSLGSDAPYAAFCEIAACGERTDLPTTPSHRRRSSINGLTMPVAPAKSIKLYRQICDRISEAIVRGDHPVGSRLPAERELADKYGVSRPTIREAMIALEMQDVVASRHGSGIYVVGLPGDIAPELDVGAFELAEARRLVEGETAALAATMIDDDGLKQLEKCLVEMDSPDEDKAVAADREFHLSIARATGNGALVVTVTTLWDMRDRSPLARRIFSRSRNLSLTPRIEEHRGIIGALRARDPNAARRAMRDHLDRVIDLLLATTETEAVEQARQQARAQRERMAARAV